MICFFIEEKRMEELLYMNHLLWIGKFHCVLIMLIKFLVITHIDTLNIRHRVNLVRGQEFKSLLPRIFQLEVLIAARQHSYILSPIRPQEQ